MIGEGGFILKIEHGPTMSGDSIVSIDGRSEHRGVERRQNERRKGLRFPFNASVDAVEPQSKSKISGRTSDISSGGCYVNTISPFPVETIIKIRLTKETVTFEAEAKIILSQVGMGMGVAFISAMPKQIRIFQKWLNELQGKSSHEPDIAKQTEKGAAQRNSINEQDYVLSELIVALIRKGVLSDDEGKAMLRKLFP